MSDLFIIIIKKTVIYLPDKSTWNFHFKFNQKASQPISPNSTQTGNLSKCSSNFTKAKSLLLKPLPQLYLNTQSHTPYLPLQVLESCLHCPRTSQTTPSHDLLRSLPRVVVMVKDWVGKLDWWRLVVVEKWWWLSGRGKNI